MAYGYKLAGKAASAAADFFPSLIGVKEDQRTPGASDTYFEQVDLPLYYPGCITSIEATRMVSYDSLPLDYRDPILACKAAGFGFYITASEAMELAAEEGDQQLAEMVRMVVPSFKAAVQ